MLTPPKSFIDLPAPTEIERRFLVDRDSLRRILDEVPLADRLEIAQFYLSADPEHVVRIRIEWTPNNPSEKRAIFAVKGPRCGITRTEQEYDIPLPVAEALRDFSVGRTITKVRYRIPDGRIVWEVDLFQNELQSLAIAEVELQSEDQKVDMPAWLGREITDDGHFSNAALATASDEVIQSLV